MSETDWDRLHRWEWFRREAWRSTFRERLVRGGGGICRAFAELTATIDGQVALDAACGLGRKTVVLADKGVNVLGADRSGYAVARARELARLEGVSATFFESSWAGLPEAAPHRFDALLVDALGLTPTWEELRDSLAGLGLALRPGGFLMFVGAPEGEDAEAALAAFRQRWSEAPGEEACWYHRDGGTACFHFVERRPAEDFLDERRRFAVCEKGETRLEETVLRRPGYWHFELWRELTRNAGFCHLETRTYPGYGPEGEDLRLNVAWKAKNDGPGVDQEARNAPYRV